MDEELEEMLYRLFTYLDMDKDSGFPRVSIYTINQQLMSGTVDHELGNILFELKEWYESEGGEL